LIKKQGISHYCNKKKRSFDLHGKHFQNWCLEYTNSLKNIDKIKKLSIGTHAEKRILRARVYAISTREEIGKKKNIIKDGMEVF
jgi:hypothetical protein